MGPVANLYARTFFVAALLFGAALAIPGILAGVLMGHRIFATVLVVCITASVVYGGLMALIAGSYHVHSVKKRGFAPTAENLSVRQSRTVIVNYGYEEAFARCLAAVHSLKRVSIGAETSSESGVIQARTRQSNGGGGEKIWIRLRARSERSTFVTVKCRPAMVVLVVDYGRSLRNTTAILNSVQEKTFTRSL
jgi:hypothetical protein